jgi:pimeloyl-ACP methyl ester carboxylesterase
MGAVSSVLERLRTADGERLHGTLLPGPGETCLVLAHGFGVSSDRRAVRRVAAALSAHVTVLSYDARGHGRSTGHTTLGDREVLDVDAAVAAARELGFRQVVTCGWSMGAGAVVRHAGLRGQQVAGHPVSWAPDAVVAVSTGARWSTRATATPPLRRLHLVVETRPGRAFARRFLGTRVSPEGWDPVPVPPADCVAAVAPLPLLVVHGDRDLFFPVHHPHALVAAATGPVELWLEPGFGHAEAAAGPELLDRLGRHLPALLARGPALSGDAAPAPPGGTVLREGVR